MTGVDRRAMLMGTLGAGLGLSAAGAWRPAVAAAPPPSGPSLNAADFGAVGDGKTDDTDALQRALAAVIGGRNGGLLVIPPGTYRVTRTLHVETPDKPRGNVTHACVVRAHGARLLSAIGDGKPVVELVSRAVVRFLTVEGLEIQGNGSEGHGLSLRCIERGRYLYNICLRDLVVQSCGGDGCRMIGNIFESQIFNSYFRDNRGNGATFSHGPQDTVLSALHVFGCVFGGNGVHGVELAKGAADVGFQGCYFLLNGKFGLSAPSGCTLLSHCGFENNHRAAGDFAKGDAGIWLKVQGTLVGCTAYSIEHQTHLIRAAVTENLVMVGCSGGGGGKAKRAGLARLQGDGRGQVLLMGTRGKVSHDDSVDVVDLGAAPQGRFPSNWDNPRLARLGKYRLWVDGDGQLRIKQGRPTSDRDGRPVGT